ncbi:4-amino-4-deoxy-L-arabinose transferase-like glycosyltransferase [Streptacidiphilus sp. MAP12-33]|uniref:glycosyltransferase family 39 protein n=1 Tax=Streptacidiphilus sp. MAP12-33 TaxID=3156266 RepID=UPI0035130CE1
MRARGKVQSVLPPFAAAPVAAIATAVAALLLALSGRYGFHRDELYFLLAGHHLAWGYPDQPPLTPLLARLGADLFGATPTGIRVVPALLAAGAVALTALIARELGTERDGQVLAAAAAACSGFLLGNGHLLSTATFDLAAWLVIALLTLRLLRTAGTPGAARWWPLLGLAVGIAALNKLLVLVLVPVLVAAALTTGPRGRFLPRPRELLGPLTALLAALPFAVPVLWWQAAHGWPELAVGHNISAAQGLGGRLVAIPLQLLQLSPLLAPLWIAGLKRLLCEEQLRWARPVAVTWLLLCALVLVGGGKGYYPIPLLYAVTAAGCAPFAHWLRHRRGKLALLLGAMLLTSALAALPVLPASALTVPMAVDPDIGEEVGWQELTAATATGWAAIPPAERAHAVVLTANYGEAGAIAHYGPALGLPMPYSGHMGLWFWGPPPTADDGPVLLVHPAHSPALEQHFRDCRPVARVDNGHGTPNMEQHAAVVLCAGPDRSWAALWPLLRRY